MSTPREILVNTYNKSGELVQRIMKSNDERIEYLASGQYKDTFDTNFNIKKREIRHNPDRVKSRGGHWDYDKNEFVWNKTKSNTPKTKGQKIAMLQAKLNALLAS